MGGIYKLAKSSYGKRRFSFTTATSGQGDLPRTFHGNGPTDMARILKVYSDGGFRGAMRPDHAPTLEGENRPICQAARCCNRLREGHHGRDGRLRIGADAETRRMEWMP